MRARSPEAKQQRTEDLLDAAARLAADLGGVRHLTLAAVTEAAGLHPSAVRRYFASKEELLLELAERGWEEWRDVVAARLERPLAGEAPTRGELTPAETAETIASTLASMPLFCDLLTHVPLSLEGDVDLERARRFKTRAFAAYDEIVELLTGTMAVEQLHELIAAALAMTANFWQLSHPTASLAELYRQEPRWGHVALEFEPKLTRLLQATARGLQA
ncbi:TetR family transcriptional regulator [Kribbella sp. NPDC051770]|uniref:TetR family transcriptional regulator n=1 Tax=Kribbella sp. NPDC051770 TaxID=3155413 RepID=UPI00342B7545